MLALCIQIARKLRHVYSPNIPPLQCLEGKLKCVLVKSVRSALSDLLTTSATHGTFSRPNTKRGLILIGLELNTNARESFEHC